MVIRRHRHEATLIHSNLAHLLIYSAPLQTSACETRQQQRLHPELQHLRPTGHVGMSSSYNDAIVACARHTRSAQFVVPRVRRVCGPHRPRTVIHRRQVTACCCGSGNMREEARQHQQCCENCEGNTMCHDYMQCNTMATVHNWVYTGLMHAYMYACQSPRETP
jgi:hypothetical protein